MARLRKPPKRQCIAARLLELRLAEGLTQGDMAARLDLSLRAYQNYEQGLRDLPGEVYFTIFEEFDLDPVWLHSGDGLGPKLRSKGREVDLWRIAATSIQEVLSETGQTVPSEKLVQLLEAIVDHLKAGGEANRAVVSGLVKLAA